MTRPQKSTFLAENAFWHIDRQEMQPVRAAKKTKTKRKEGKNL